MESIVIETELEPRDWDALQLYLQRRFVEQGLSRRQKLLEILVVTLVVAVSMYALTFINRALNPLALVCGVLVGATAILMISRMRLRQFRPVAGSYFLAPTRLAFDADGIHSGRSTQKSFIGWQHVSQVDETAEHVFMPIDRVMAFVIPKRSLGSLAADEFVARVKEMHAAGRDGAASVAASQVPPVLESEVLSAPRAAEEAHGAEAAAPTDVSTGLSDGASADASPESRPGHEQGIQHGSQPDRASQYRSGSPPGFLRGLKSNLRAGARIFFLRPVHPGALVTSFDQVLALFVVALVTTAVFDWLRIGPGAEFEYYGLYSWFTCMLFGVWMCALAARTLSQSADTRSLLVPVLAVTPYVIVVLWLFSKLTVFAANEALFLCAVLVFIFAMALRAVRVAHGFVRPLTFGVIVVCVLGIAATNEYLYLDTRLWSEPQPEELANNAMADHYAAEAIIFDESARIAAAVENVEPERPGTSDVFYVGFGGDGMQRVFRREVMFGQRVFDARMGSGSRSLMLINDYEDRDTYPLATVSGLRYGLSLVAERMNREEDVLVLFLTSHGSQEGGIAVRNGILPLNRSLRPEDVREVLDATRIKWRIVIVSACYAGVFLEPLRSDTTLVITAADPDHNSFGCADDRDLTYFGEAFLRDALPKAESLEAAFEEARTAIEQRERSEKKTPSNPQFQAGDAMRAKLVELGKLPFGSVATATHK